MMKEEILLIDKPAGWTSFDVVAKIRGELRRKQISNNNLQVTNNSQTSKIQNQKSKKIKVGHAGTLDPFATGLLIILLGDACKRAGEFLKLDKTYEFTAKLGEVSSTGDPEGTISKTQKVKRKKVVIPGSIGDPVESIERSESEVIPSSQEVLQVLKQFTGEIIQTPPAYSAIKIDGKRAYKLAREGKEFDIPSRKVTINKLDLFEYNYPYLKCVCDVSSGTYIRSLVEDIGKSLNTGAFCTQLRRVRIGKFDIKNAKKVETSL